MLKSAQWSRCGALHGPGSAVFRCVGGLWAVISDRLSGSVQSPRSNVQRRRSAKARNIQRPTFEIEQDRTRTRSGLEPFMTHRLPALNETPFLGAASRLPRGVIMGMEMRRALRHGFLQPHVTLQALMQVARLRNVNGNPTAVLGLSGINVKAWQGSKARVNGIDLVLIRVAGLPKPSAGGGRCALRMRVTAK